MRKNSMSLLLSVVFVGVIACGGGKKVLISQAEIDNAEANGTLSSLYQKTVKLAAETSGSDKKESLSLQSKIAAILVKNKTQDIKEVLNLLQQDPKSVSRQKLIEVQSSLLPMKQWSETDYLSLNTQLDTALSTVNDKINTLLQKSQQETNLVASIFALEEGAKLAGNNQPETANYQEQFQQAKIKLLDQGAEAMNQRAFKDAIDLANQGLLLEPGNVQFDSLLSQSQAGLFEKDFRFALENGKPELAYLSLLDVAEKPIFLQLKKSMSSSISLLSNYFANNAQSAYQKGELLAAYVSFQKGRTIQDKLDISQKGFVQEKAFVDLLINQSNEEGINIGRKHALLRIAKEFDSSYPGLEAEYNKLSEAIKNRAMTKLSIAEFKEVLSSDSIAASVGRRISSKLEKILFERLGEEVLIVVDLSEQANDGFSGLALKIEGEVLQAAIEESSNQGKRSINVQTGIQQVETEEYLQWSKRKRGEAPVRYQEKPLMEDIILSIEHIQKQGIAEVAFRIVEPKTGKILLTNNFVKESEFKGESTNEYQKGDFHQRYVRADLPSNIKIMDNLATELATQLGDTLGNYLANPEKIFYQKYQEKNLEEDKLAATELLSNALLISESKKQNIVPWYNELKELVLQ